MRPTIPRWLSAALTSAALVAAVTAVIALLEPEVPALGLGVLYLVAVVPIALMYGGAVAAAVSVASMLTFDFIFLAPRHSLDPGSSEQVEVLAAFLVSSLVIGQAAARLQGEARRSARLAADQAALRRVATLVAGGARPEEVFPAIVEEVGRLLPIDLASMCRYEPDGTLTWIAAWGEAGKHFPVGSRRMLGGRNLGTIIFETGRPARLDHYADVASGPIGVAAHEAGINSSLATPIMVEGRLWGVIAAGSMQKQPLPADTEARLAAFTELAATAISNAESQAARGRLADEQAALRRVATLVAQRAPPAELFSAVSQEVGQLVGADQSAVGRFEPDGPSIVALGIAPDVEGVPVGTRWELDDAMASTAVYRTGRAARLDQSLWGTASGPIPDTLRRMGLRTTVASPIVVEGRLWGAITASTTLEPLPPDTEERLANFTKLVATAIANLESRAALGRLAKEQAALRRVATLVAKGAPPAAVFSTLGEEVNRLLDAQTSAIARLEADRTVTIVANSGATADALAVGNRLKPEPGWVLTAVIQTGRPARKDDYANATQGMQGVIRGLGIHSSVAAPIVVEGALWGVIVVGTERERFPDGTEQRLEEFTALAATAIANAESRAEVAASRARIVEASDETRRRIERNLHDGIQQRLVSVGLELRAAQASVPPQLDELQGELSRVAEGLASVFDEVREISQGIHPPVLSKGGLEPALKALCRRSAVPVELDLRAERRLPERVEVAAYYVVSETLANASKHAQASIVRVVAEERDHALHLSIRDDGLGGADPAKGSGLTGLRDRVEAVGGSINISSRLGEGTLVVVDLPFRLDHTFAAMAPSEAAP